MARLDRVVWRSKLEDSSQTLTTILAINHGSCFVGKVLKREKY